MGAGSKLMPLTQQPSFEAVKTLDVTPSTRAGNTKTLSYLVRLVLYTEPSYCPYSACIPRIQALREIPCIPHRIRQKYVINTFIIP